MAGNETEVYVFFTHIWSASLTVFLIFTGSVCPTRWRIFLHFRLPGWVIIMAGLDWAATVRIYTEEINGNHECVRLCVFRSLPF